MIFKFIFWPLSLESHSGQHRSNIAVRVKCLFWQYLHKLKSQVSFSAFPSSDNYCVYLASTVAFL